MTTTPRQFGLVKVSEALWVTEGISSAVPNTAIANSAASDFPLLNFTMPYAGELTAEMYFEFICNSYQQVNARLHTSSPAPVQYTDMPRITDAATAGGWRGFLPAFARWENLAASQVVALKCNIYAGSGGATTLFRWHGLVRANMQA